MSEISAKVPRVGVAVLAFNKEGLLLMGKRKGSDLGLGCFQCAGGGLEFGESIEECALRELVEEANLVGTDPRIVAVTNNVYPEQGKHYITLWVLVNVADPSTLLTVEQDKCEGWGWHSTDNLPSPLFEPSDILTPERLRSLRENSLGGLAIT